MPSDFSVYLTSRLMPGADTLRSLAAPPIVPVTITARITSTWRSVIICEFFPCHGTCFRSGWTSIEQFPTAEIVDREKNPLKIIPPDPAANTSHRLPNRSGDEPEHRQPIIIAQQLA